MPEPMYLYSEQRRHVADPEDTTRTRRRALCGALFLTEAEVVARFRRCLTGDLTLNRRVERAKKLPVCSWCSRRWATLAPAMVSLAGDAPAGATGSAEPAGAPSEETTS